MTKFTEDRRQKAEDRIEPPGVSRNVFFSFYLLSSVFCISLLSCENDIKKVFDDGVRKPNIETAINIESFLSQNGKLKAKLISPLMWRYAMDTSYLEFPKTLHVNFFDSTTKVDSQVNALYGKYFESRSQVYLRDSVVVFNTKGDTLRAPELWWDQNTRKFYTNKRVRIRRKDQQIIGDNGMEATQDLNDIKIYQIASPSFITVPDSMKVQ